MLVLFLFLKQMIPVNEPVLFFFFLTALDLHCSEQAFSSSGQQGLLFIAVHGLLAAVASLVVEHRL